MNEPVLATTDLRVTLHTGGGPVTVVHGVDLVLRTGETLALVGESGAGKSVTARAVMGLLDARSAEVTGSVRVLGRETLRMTAEERRRLRGRTMSMIFQDPYSALNPVIPIGPQIGEVIRNHRTLSRAAVRARVVELLGLVQIEDAERRYHAYPHQFSGGMQQRVMIAMAIALEPDVLIADEPTTALDVTVQAQILTLLRRLADRSARAMLLITHDLGIVAENADRVGVMYAGRVVETGPTQVVFAAPAHPYTLGLLHARPTIGERQEKFAAIPGAPPDPAALPPGCPFHPRCAFATARCTQELPPPRDLGDGQWSACHHAETVRPAGGVA